MKAEELTVLEQHELTDKLKQSRRELYELRFQVAVGQLENNRQIRKVKKDIARILTVIHQRELTSSPTELSHTTEIAAAPPPAAEAAETSPTGAEEVEESEDE